jgi:hypothetical protein
VISALTTLTTLTLLAPPMVSAGDDTACMVHDGQVFCWGEGNDGELGNGAAQGAREARRVIGIDDALSVSVGDDIVCALHRDRTVSCWGEAADSSDANRLTPQRVDGVRDVVDVQAIDRSACALDARGRLICWGARGLQHFPKLPPAERMVVRRGVGCLIQAGPSRDVVCWDFERARPERIKPVSRPWARGAVDLAVNNGGLCALTRDTLICGMALDGGVPQSTSLRATRIDIEDDRGCALDANGQVHCTSALRGAKAGGLRVVPGLPPAVDLSVGEDFACAITRAGAVWCWGEGSSGQLGDGQARDSKVPVCVRGVPEHCHIWSEPAR